MLTASAVIGANYGDEGKGVVTDFLCDRIPALKSLVVVRYNGGAQAGHTVTLPDGRRHVHHHFGSGTLDDYPSFLSRFFLVNPMIFSREWQELAALKVTPTVFIDPQAPITTPYDMMINQAAEESRGKCRYGSCGLGINETVVRQENPEFKLVMRDLDDREKVINQLRNIRAFYTPTRLKDLGVKELPRYLMDDGILNSFLQDLNFLMAHSITANYSGWWEHVIFEGAQGLRLDECAPGFPHVTRSRTGLTNILTLAQEFGIHKLDAYYVTRPYITRHGAGPLSYELPVNTLPYPNVRDDTNVAGPWQGKLRFGWFDLNEFAGHIERDYDQAIVKAVTKNIKVVKHLAVTCLDQVNDSGVVCKWVNPDYKCSTDLFCDVLAREINASNVITFNGPCRTNGQFLVHQLAGV